MLDKILNELIPRQAEEIKKAVRDGIPIMIVDNTGSGCEAREKLRCELKANNAILIPDTVAEFRKYNTAYLRIDLNVEGGESMGVDFTALKKEIQRANMTYSNMAEKLGITRSAFSKKMSGVNDFKASQVWEIKKILNLSGEKAEEIFLSGNSKNIAPLTPYSENGFKEATVAVREGGSLEIAPTGEGEDEIEKAHIIIVTDKQIKKMKHVAKFLNELTELVSD